MGDGVLPTRTRRTLFGMGRRSESWVGTEYRALRGNDSARKSAKRVRSSLPSPRECGEGSGENIWRIIKVARGCKFIVSVGAKTPKEKRKAKRSKTAAARKDMGNVKREKKGLFSDSSELGNGGRSKNAKRLRAVGLVLAGPLLTAMINAVAISNSGPQSLFYLGREKLRPVEKGMRNQEVPAYLALCKPRHQLSCQEAEGSWRATGMRTCSPWRCSFSGNEWACCMLSLSRAKRARRPLTSGGSRAWS